MKLAVKRQTLADALAIVNRATSDNRADNILANVKLTTEGQQLVITGTDRDLTITATVDAEITSQGTVLANGAYLGQMAQTAKGDEVYLTLDGVELGVQAGRASWRLRVYDAKMFPLVDHLPVKATMPAATFLAAVRRVLPAVSRDNQRPVLQGIHFDNAAEEAQVPLKLVATDSYRMSIQDLGTGVPEIATSITVPGSALAELARLKGAEELGIGMSNNKLTFAVDGIQITSRLIEGTFPPYRRLVEGNDPSTRNHVAKVNRELLIDALKRVSLLAGDKSHTVILKFEDKAVILSAAKLEVGDAEEVLDGAIYQGPDQKMGFNSRFLAEGLDAAGTTEVEFYFGGTNLPIVMLAPGDTGFYHLLMPVAVQ